MNEGIQCKYQGPRKETESATGKLGDAVRERRLNSMVTCTELITTDPLEDYLIKSSKGDQD